MGLGAVVVQVSARLGGVRETKAGERVRSVSPRLGWTVPRLHPLRSGRSVGSTPDFLL